MILSPTSGMLNTVQDQGGLLVPVSAGGSRGETQGSPLQLAVEGEARGLFVLCPLPQVLDCVQHPRGGAQDHLQTSVPCAAWRLQGQLSACVSLCVQCGE